MSLQLKPTMLSKKLRSLLLLKLHLMPLQKHKLRKKQNKQQRLPPRKKLIRERKRLRGSLLKRKLQESPRRKKPGLQPKKQSVLLPKKKLQE